MTTALLCPSCGDPVVEDDDFCESCGTRLRPPARAEEGACPKCGAGAEQTDRDGYCGRCGYRLGRTTDHVEVEMDGLAAVSDRGLRHHRNEDAAVLRAGNGYRVIVVCDGVSTTANPDQASAAAAAALADVVEAGLTGREPTADEVLELLAQGVSSAQQAVLAVPADEPGGHVQAPSTTLAAVVIRAGDILAANIGDSRAYWISAGESLQLGRDDSLAEEAIAAGASPSDAYATREAHTITHWLGADAPRLAPHTRSVAAGSEGTVLVCSDGLWNYFKSPGALRDLLLEGPEAETPLAAARRLVEAAIAAGGADNITVAIGPVPAGGPAQPVEPSPEPPAEPAPEPTQPPELPIEAEE